MKLLIYAKGDLEKGRELVRKIEEGVRRKLRFFYKLLLDIKVEEAGEEIIFTFNFRGLGAAPIGLAQKGINDAIEAFKELLTANGFTFLRYEVK